MMGDVTAESPPTDELNNSGSSSSSSSDSDGESSSSCSSSSSSSCSETPNRQCNSSNFSEYDENTPQTNGQSEWIVCQLCLHKVKTPLQLKQHMRMHTEHKVHRCAICNKTFEQATRLEKHITIHCGTDSRFECALCGKVYKLRTQIVSHIAAHKKQNSGRRISYTCHLCTKKFSNKSKLKEHVLGHENGTLHSCDVCGRTFKLNSYLVVHKRTHEMNVSYTGDKPFTCTLCNKAFLSKSNLDLHMLVHNYVKKASFSCDICGKIFMRKYNYDAHTKIHQ
ncbi:Zinc finger C2H2-type [Cinara cedri]|uniref:Zinc finger C2H2-type n=1 Tax=Cinara cedri TaxID=506608 RepID=A0A5E4N0F6_9HEMI|nr:Zinc finger C2H2-type [Cinara cedri]